MALLRCSVRKAGANILFTQMRTSSRTVVEKDLSEAPDKFFDCFLEAAVSCSRNNRKSTIGICCPRLRGTSSKTHIDIFRRMQIILANKHLVAMRILEISYSTFYATLAFNIMWE